MLSFVAAAALTRTTRSDTTLARALQELESNLDDRVSRLERVSIDGLAAEDDTHLPPDWDAVEGTEFSVLMEVSGKGKLVGSDVAEGKVVCDKDARGDCEKIAAGGHGQVYFGKARVRVHEKTSSGTTDSDFTGSVVIKESTECMIDRMNGLEKPSDVTIAKEQGILRHLQKNRGEEGGANLMSVYGFYTMKPMGDAKDDWNCDIIAEQVPYPITWETAWHPKAVGQLVPQALLGLGFMHRHHTAHLDLKPENMMSHINPSTWSNTEGIKLAPGTIKLIDTGGGEEDRKRVHLFESEFTRSTAVASPLYYPPELAKADGQKIKPYKADIWSMGIVAVALLCGMDHYEQSQMEKLSKDIDSQDTADQYIHAVFPFTTSDDWRGDNFKEAREFVNAALKYDPDNRPTVAQLLEMDFVAA